MRITDYFQEIEKIITECPAVTAKEISCDQRTSHIGFIKGTLIFHDASQLHFKEFIDTEDGITKYKYGYHYQKENNIIFRYDNVAHINKPTPFHHKHLFPALKITAIDEPPTLTFILKEIISILP